VNDLDSLVAAIEDAPFDATAQKAFADCLEENGLPDSAAWLRANGSFLRKTKGDGGYGGGGGDGDGGDGGYGGGLINNIRSYAVRDGLHILSMPGGYNPYVLIGWVERQDFILRVRGARVIRRFGQSGQLAKLATGGPIKGSNPTQLLDASAEEFVALAVVSRAIPCDPKKWAKECPKPESEFAEVEA